jgi:hypothetical protein
MVSMNKPSGCGSRVERHPASGALLSKIPTALALFKLIVTIVFIVAVYGLPELIP